MTTRKNKKSNKRFRKTRSKRQRGGRLTQNYNNQEDDPNNALEEPAYQDVPNNEEWVRQLDCPLNNFDEREVEYRWQQQTNRGLPRGAGHLSGNKAMWRDICQDFVRDLTPDQIRIRRDEQTERRQTEEERAERRHRETNGGKRRTRKSKKSKRKTRKTKTRKTRSKKQRGGMYRKTSRPKNYIACGVMYNNEGKILMAKRKSNNPNHPNKWEFPGGKKEDGETIFECLEREWKEEMNLFIDITPPPVASMKCGHNKICHFLVGRILDEDALELKEVAEVKYLTENEILELDDDLLLDKNDKLVIQRLINEGGIKRVLYLDDLKMNLYIIFNIIIFYNK